jgi:hypothetical protein
MSNKTTFLKDAILKHVLRISPMAQPAGLYLALMKSDPGDDGLSGTEVSGGSYVRRSITMVSVTSDKCQNSNAISFPTPTADWGKVTHWVIFSAINGGNALLKGELDVEHNVKAGDSPLQFGIGSIVATET